MTRRTPNTIAGGVTIRAGKYWTIHPAAYASYAAAHAAYASYAAAHAAYAPYADAHASCAAAYASHSDASDAADDAAKKQHREWLSKMNPFNGNELRDTAATA